MNKLGLSVLGMMVSAAWIIPVRADVQMSAGECAATFGQLPITIVNKNPTSQQMDGYFVTMNGTLTEGKFETGGLVPYLVAPNASPAFKWVTCPAVGTPKHLQLQTTRGACNDLEPPAAAAPMACTPLRTVKPNYDPAICIKDSLATGRGDGFGGIVDSYRDQTQIQVRIPAASFTVNGKSVRFDPKSMGGPYYMMGLMAVQEFFYVDMQFLMALGASKSGAGLVDASGVSQYVPAINDGASEADSKFGSFGLNYITAKKVMQDYPKHFTSLDDIKMMVADNGTGVTLANSPQQVNSAMLGSMNLWWYMDATQNGKSLCFKQFLKTAKDKSAGLKILLAGYENGPSGGGDGADFASRVLPKSVNMTAHDAADITPFMKPYLWGDAATGKGTTQYVTNVFSSLNAITKSGATCGGEPIYDSPISRAEIKGLFFGQGGTAAKPGPGGLHWHIKMSATERAALDADLDCAFDALKGQSPSTQGLDAVSFRYDLLSILRVAKSHFGSYLDKFHDGPSPADGYSSDYNSFLRSHATPACPDIVIDTEWPRLVLTGETLNKGQVIEDPATKDNIGIESRQYSTDPNWQNWTEAPANFTVPAGLAASQGLWYRISDSCGNTTTEKVPWTDGPPLDKVVATPGSGPFFGSVSVTLDVPSVTGEDIYYTIDGNPPTFSSLKYDPTKPIVITTDLTVKAFANKAGFSPGPIETFIYTKQILPVTKAPTADPPGKSFTTLDPAFTVTLAPGETGSKIFYTTDNTAPDTLERGTTRLYAGPITVDKSTVIQALATKPNQIASPVMIATYTETEAPKVATPVATPPGTAGTSPFRFINAPLTVGLTVATDGAAIFYRLDDAAPVPFAGALSIAKTTTVKAYATKAGSVASDTLIIQFLHTPPVSVAKAFYKDANGDGGIETVVIRFDKDLSELPAKLGFKITDQGSQINDRTAAAGEIAYEGSAKNALIVTLKEPFPYGVTSVVNRDASGHLFRQDNIPLSEADFAIDDSVPPVVSKATVQEPDSANPQKRIFISISETTNLDLGSKTAFVFKHEGTEASPAEKDRGQGFRDLHRHRFRDLSHRRRFGGRQFQSRGQGFGRKHSRPQDLQAP
jgi:hypothetical protein